MARSIKGKSCKDVMSATKPCNVRRGNIFVNFVKFYIFKPLRRPDA